MKYLLFNRLVYDQDKQGWLEFLDVNDESKVYRWKTDVEELDELANEFNDHAEEE